MAVWQFDLYFIVRGGSVPDLNSDDWKEPMLPPAMVYELQRELAYYMGPPWLMLPDWIVFGPENGNRIDVLFEAGDAGTVVVRFDDRDDAPQFPVLVCNIARSHGCAFFSAQSRRLIEPTLDALDDVSARS